VEFEDYALLAVLSGIWGASFLFIKVAVTEMPPVWVTFGRSVFGAAGLVAVLFFSRVSWRGIRRHWRSGLVVAVFNAALPYTLFAFGETFIDSSLAGILNATLPLWTVLMSPLWVEAERLVPRQLVGLALGFSGAVVVAHPGRNLLAGNSIGAFMCLGATLSYAFTTHYSRRHFQQTPPQLTAFMQCVGAALLLLPLAVLFHPSRVPSSGAIGAIAALGVGGTGIGMTLAYRLVKRIGASRTTVVTYLLPPSALFWGFVVLHERPDATVFLALALILSGVFLINARRVPAREKIGPEETLPEVGSG
jgi:drug/metabolite transporter (DMT)-like permease